MMIILRVIILNLLSLPAVAAPAFLQCLDFGCKTTQEIQYTDSDWDEIKTIFADGAADSESEKQLIRRAIARMESISGELSGTHLDQAGNYPGSDLPGQMDCIDESTNTFQYLSALEESGLLRWHQVAEKQRRIVWFVTHWTATISEIDSKQRYAVDSWYRDNGDLPLIQTLENWMERRDFQAVYNPELAAD